MTEDKWTWLRCLTFTLCAARGHARRMPALVLRLIAAELASLWVADAGAMLAHVLCRWLHSVDLSSAG